MNEHANHIWQLFIQEAIVDLPAHLMTYPYAIGADGSLSPVLGSELVPDSKAKILGSSTYALPDILTT